MRLGSVFRTGLGLAYLFAAVFVGISLALRIALFVKSFAVLDFEWWTIPAVVGVGLFFDLVTVTYFAFPYVFVLILVPDRVFRSTPFRAACYAAALGSLYLLLFAAVAEWFFFDEFGTRFNFIAVDYLVYTHEMLRNIWESYPLIPILGAILLASVALFTALLRPMGSAFKAPTRLRQRAVWAAPFLVLPLPLLATVDGSWSKVSCNSYANELASNGIYSLFAAFRNNEIDYRAFYPTIDQGVAMATLRRELAAPYSTFVSDQPLDIRRDIHNGGGGNKLNVVLVVVESLSAEFLRVLGGRGRLTPHLDQLANQGLLFTNLYATGTRTDRGLEAITLSVPPTPGRSILKRPGNEGMFSLGLILGEHGYDVKFIYGGYGYFDNMNYFLAHNGFVTIDRTDLAKDEITFENAWGVCDEDLFRKSLREIRKSHEGGRPVFALVLTTSNHRPYTYPSGKVAIASGTGRAGAVQYTDYAIGNFIEAARTESWFKDTLFVIVADHCANSAGKAALPVHRYRIPLLVYSPSHVSPRRVDTMASQIDIAPTLLGLLHMDYRDKFFGKDALGMMPAEGRALIATYQKLGYLKDNRLVVLDVKREASSYLCNLRTGELKKQGPDPQMIEEAISYYQMADAFHRRGLDRWSVVKPALAQAPRAKAK